MEITSTEAQNNFGQYLKLAAFEEIIVTKNGKRAVVIKQYGKESSNSSICEKGEAYNFDSSKITYEEFIMLSDRSDNRYEYIDGEVYLLASPTYDHQNIIVEILNILYQWFKGKKCRPLTAPFDVTLIKNKNEDNINVVQPDILVVCDTDKVNDRSRYKGVPSLVVEVLSETTKRKDLVKKLDLYINSGVNEYLIVNPFNKEVYLYSFKDYEIVDYKVFKGTEIVHSIFFDGLTLPLVQIFEHLK